MRKITVAVVGLSLSLIHIYFYPLTKFLNDAISRVPFDVTKKSAPEEQKRRESYKSYKGGRYYNYSHELRPETFEKDKYSV